MGDAVVSAEVISAVIESFTSLDQSGDRIAMNDLARRLGKEQPALLQSAARIRGQHGDAVGEAAVFYATLMWAMFDRAHPGRVPRLLASNIEEAQKVVDAELAPLAEAPLLERIAPGVRERQPHLVAKLVELLAEDIKEAAIPEPTAAIIIGPTQTAIEAFDAAVSGKRPGQSIHPIVREEPKVGRNDPCLCGSGKKYKRCHGGAEI